MSKVQLTYPQFKSFGRSAIIAEWPAEIDPKVLETLLIYKNMFQKFYHKVNVEVINTYNSITLFYNEGIENIYDEILTLKLLKPIQIDLKNQGRKRWKIPVCYAPEFGLDLTSMASQKQVSIAALIELHTSPIYTLYFMGFMPGFMYLGGLDPRLHTPRKDQPRLKVAKGAVGIAGHQTGIYPESSPGGWQIFGNCPINLFNPALASPCFARPGDEVVFFPICLKEHMVMQNEGFNPEFESL